MKFENIKVGDRIVYDDVGRYHHETIVAKVINVSKAQFVCDDCSRFYKSDGRKVGDSSCFCKLATEEDVKKFEKQKRRKYLALKISNFAQVSFRLHDLTTEELETIYAITKKYDPL